MHGRLIGASLGPGDPALITRAAWDALSSDACWAWAIDDEGRSHAIKIVERAGLFPRDDGLALHFPATENPQALARAWTEAAVEVATVLHGGDDMVFLIEGDASTCAEFGHLARGVLALDPSLAIETIPGVTSFSAAAAATGRPLAHSEAPVAIYSASEALRDLDRLCDAFDALVLVQVRPVLNDLIGALDQGGWLDRAVLVERVGTRRERIVWNLRDLLGTRVSDGSLVLIRRDPRR